MKNIIILITAVLFSTGTIFADASVKKTTIKVPTVQCDECSDNIIKALEKVDGFISADVFLEKKVVKIKYDETKTNIKALETAISKAGYKANNKKADKDAYNKLSECCKVQ
jgi:copper chaperone CopZ